MNAQIQTYHDAVLAAALHEQVASFEPVRNVKIAAGKTVNGYMLRAQSGVRLAIIETLRPLPRIEALLTDYALGNIFDGSKLTARELMRSLLNAEDYRSEIYDVIVRVHYREDF